MKEFTPFTVMTNYAVQQRVSQGLLEPMHAGYGLEALDCGDERGLTETSLALRTSDFGHRVKPGRVFGAHDGAAAATLIAFAASYGDAAVGSFLGNFGPDAFTDFSTDLSSRAAKAAIVGYKHSADIIEQKSDGLNENLAGEKPLGCAFITLLGKLAHAAGQQNILEEAQIFAEYAETALPLKEASEGARILAKYLPEDLSIRRKQVNRAQAQMGGRVAILAGNHVPTHTTKLTLDFAGFRSDANAHMEQYDPRYHHTPGLAAQIAIDLLPEFNLNRDLLVASSTLLGDATRAALSGPENPLALEVEIIPENLAVAA